MDRCLKCKPELEAVTEPYKDVYKDVQKKTNSVEGYAFLSLLSPLSTMQSAASLAYFDSLHVGTPWLFQ
jgi:hypothetical protein